MSTDSNKPTILSFGSTTGSLPSAKERHDSSTPQSLLTCSSSLSPTAAPFNPFSAASLVAGPAPFHSIAPIDVPELALGAVVPRKPEKAANPVYVKNTFLEADGLSSFTIDAMASYRSRTESCDAVLEGSRRHKLSSIQPETVHEIHDDGLEGYDDYGTTDTDKVVEGIYNRLKVDVGLPGIYEIQDQNTYSQKDSLNNCILYPPHDTNSKLEFLNLNNDIHSVMASLNSLTPHYPIGDSITPKFNRPPAEKSPKRRRNDNNLSGNYPLRLKSINGHLHGTINHLHVSCIPSNSPSSSPNHEKQQFHQRRSLFTFYDKDNSEAIGQPLLPISPPSPLTPHHFAPFAGNSPRHQQQQRVHACGDRHDKNNSLPHWHISGDHLGSPLGHAERRTSSVGNPSPFLPGRPFAPEGLPESTGTTIMLRNIPNKYTQEMLLDVINQNFRGLYDFFYLPIDFRNKCNVGYAFINFIHSNYAIMFKKQYDGLKLSLFRSNKVCVVSWGRVQGLQANIEHYRNSAVMSIPFPQYKPMLFKNGIVVPFPTADGPLPSVKLRRQKC